MSGNQSIFTDTTIPCWYVMRAYKCENRAEEALSSHSDLPYFIPKQYSIRTYHGVKMKKLVPAIPSLVFVYASHGEIVSFKKHHNFLQFVKRHSNKLGRSHTAASDYLIVPETQMNNFIKVASQLESNVSFYTPEEIDIKKGTRVRIHGGRFDGVEGTFMRVKGHRNRRLVILLEGIIAISIEVAPDLVEALER